MCSNPLMIKIMKMAPRTMMALTPNMALRTLKTMLIRTKTPINSKRTMKVTPSYSMSSRKKTKEAFSTKMRVTVKWRSTLRILKKTRWVSTT